MHDTPLCELISPFAVVAFLLYVFVIRKKPTK